MVGAWALGGAELAASRGDTEPARELWSLGMRIGASLSRIFPEGEGKRLAAALGDDHEPLLAGPRKLAVSDVNTRILELMDRVLTTT
jgi:hypothetical protein